jgi:dienelactone hydrolase
MLLSGCDSAPAAGVLGAYRFEDGSVISIRPSVDNTLRYRRLADPASSRLYPVTETEYRVGSGFSDPEPSTATVRFTMDGGGIAGSLEWIPDGGGGMRATRVGREQWVRFERDGTELVGRLHTPTGEGPHPAMVLVHGSGDTPGSHWLYNGDFMVANGIAVLAYDKRGTGQSGGEFTFDFHELARDAAAAVAFLRGMPGIRGDAVGLAGYSQGGWVAPLAASMTPVRFVLVSCGMLDSPAQEARMEMGLLLDREGVVGTDRTAADSLVAAAVAVVASELESGWDEFQELRDRYGDAPWLRHLSGTPVDQLVRYPRWLVGLIGPRQLPEGLRWDYDSGQVVETLCVPMTWFLADSDQSAPNALTIPRLQALSASGFPSEVRVFTGADHSMLAFEEEGRARSYTGYATGYHQAEVEAALKWIDTDPDTLQCPPGGV